MQRLQTERLEMVACSREMIEAAMLDRERLESLAGLRLPPSWPARDLAEALPLQLASASAGPDAEGWQVWLIAHAGTVVGDVGCHGAPDESGCVEIGFSIVPEMRRRGFAAEAVAAFVEMLRDHPRVRVVAARTDPGNVAARRVLHDAGLRLAAHDGPHVRYELRP